MPVVTPSRASIETVNGGLERRLVLGRHQVEAELVAALRRERQADQPAPLLGHEVDRLGRDELRGHREVALVLAVLVVADDDHAARRGCPRSPPRSVANGRARSVSRATSFSTYFASTSTSRLTGLPGLGVAERRALERLGDQRDGERVVVERARRSATRRRPRSSPSRRRSAAASGGAAIVTTRAKPSSRVSRTAPTPSTWPCTTWPPSRSVARSGSSRLTGAPAPSSRQRGAPQRLVHHVGGERARRRSPSRSGRRR